MESFKQNKNSDLAQMDGQNALILRKITKRNENMADDYVFTIPQGGINLIDAKPKEVNDLAQQELELDLPVWDNPVWTVTTGKHDIEQNTRTGSKFDYGSFTIEAAFNLDNNTKERNGKLHDLLDDNILYFPSQPVLDMYVDITSLVNGRFKWHKMSYKQYQTLRNWIGGQGKILDFLRYDVNCNRKFNYLNFIRKKRNNKWREIVAKLQATARSSLVFQYMKSKKTAINFYRRQEFEVLQQERTLQTIGQAMEKRDGFHKLSIGLKSFPNRGDQYNRKAYNNKALFEQDICEMYGSYHPDIEYRTVSVRELWQYLEKYPDNEYLQERYRKYKEIYNIYDLQGFSDILRPFKWMYNFSNDLSNVMRSFGQFLRTKYTELGNLVHIFTDFIKHFYDSVCETFEEMTAGISTFASMMWNWRLYALRIVGAMVFIAIGVYIPFGPYIQTAIAVTLSIMSVFGLNVDKTLQVELAIINSLFHASRPTNAVNVSINSTTTHTLQSIDHSVIAKCMSVAGALLVCQYMPFDMAYKSFFEKCDKIPKAIGGIMKLVDIFEEHLKELYGRLYKKATGEDFIMTKAIPTDVEQNYKDVKRLSMLNTYAEMCSDPGKCLEIENVFHTYLTLRQTHSGNRKIIEYMNGYNGTIIDLFRKAGAANPRVNSERSKPTCVMFKGTTGVGKSALMYFLSADILKHYNCFENCTPDQIMKKINQCIYARNGQQEYFDGYLNQLVCVVDDFGAQKDSQTNPNPDFNDLLRMVNNFPYPLPMASLSQKANTFFTSRFVFLTSNLDVVEPTSMINPEALRSRIAYTYDIKVKREWQVNPNGNRKEDKRIDVEKTRAAFGSRTVVDIYEFDEYNIITNEKIRTGLSYNDVLTSIVQHRTREERFFQNKQDSLLSHINRNDNIPAAPVDISHLVAHLNDSGNVEIASDNDEEVQVQAINLFEPTFYAVYRGSQLNSTFIPDDGETVRTNSVFLNVFKDLIISKVPTTSPDSPEEYYKGLLTIQHVGPSHWLEWDFWTDLFNDGDLKEDWHEYERLIFDIPEFFWTPTVIRAIATRYVERELGSIDIDLQNIDTYAVQIEQLYSYFTTLQEEEQRLIRTAEAYTSPSLTEQPPPRIYYVISISLAVIGLLLMCGRAYKSWVNDAQDDVEAQQCESGMDKRNIIRRVMESGKDKKNHVKRTLESFSSTQAEEISKLVKNNLRELYLEDRKIANVLMLRGRWALINKHYLTIFDRGGFEADTILKMTAVGHSEGVEIPYSFLLAGKAVQRSGQDTDLWIFKLPKAANMARDIIKYFHDKKSINYVTKEIPYLLVLPHGKSLIIHTTKLVEKMDKQVNMAIDNEIIGKQTCMVYEFDARTSRGDCGGVYIADSDNLRSKIVGFHFAGNVNGGASALPLVREDFALIENEPTVDCQGITYGDCPLNGQLDGIIPMGTAPPVHTATKSSIVKTKLYNKIFETTVEPAKLGRLLADDGPGLKGLQKVLPTVPYISDREVSIARISLSKKILKGKMTVRRVLTFEEAVDGNVPENAKYIKGINRSTSAGYPYVLETKNGKKQYFGSNDYVFTDKAEEVKRRIEANIESIKKENTYYQSIYIDTLKDETRPIEKVRQGKTRVFSAASMEFVILFRMYFLGFLNHVMENKITNEVAVGICAQSPDWNKLALYLLSKGNNMVAGDFTNFDGTLNTNILWAICDMANEYYSDGNDHIRELIFEDIVHSVHIAENSVYNWTHSQPSGNPGTAIINSIYNSLACRIVYNRLTQGTDKYRNFDTYINMVSYGDDNLLSIHKDIIDIVNQVTLTEGFKAIGMIYTDEEKKQTSNECKSLEMCHFLKRGFSFNKDFNIWLGPLMLPSIMERLNWQARNPTPDAVTLQNVDGAIAELALCNPSTFTMYSKKIKEVVLAEMQEYVEVYDQAYYINGIIDGRYKEMFPQLMFA